MEEIVGSIGVEMLSQMVPRLVSNRHAHRETLEPTVQPQDETRDVGDVHYDGELLQLSLPVHCWGSL